MYNQPSSSDIPASDSCNLPRKTAAADKRDLIFLILSFVAAFLLVDFGFCGGVRLGFTVAYAVLFLITTLYLAKKGDFHPFPVICGILSLCIVPVFALYCESITLGIAFLAVFFLWSIYAGSFGGVLRHGTGGFRLIYDALRTLLIYPFSFLTAPFKGMILAEKDGKKLRKIGYVLIGLGLGIPAMAILLPLMIKSDAAFASLIDIVFGQIGTLLIHVILALVLTPLLAGLLFALRHKLPVSGNRSFSVRFIVSPILCGFFGLLSFFYLFYLFSQLTYFFSAFWRILPEDFSCAGYARQGFFELCTISVINFVLMFCAFTLVKKEEAADIPTAVKGFGIFISLFNLVLVGTAISKMVLYIDNYGLTELRVLTTVFMIMMGISFICLIVRLIVPKFPYMAVSLIVCTLLGIGVLYADVNTTIARYNTEAYLSGELDTVDIGTLEDLGAAAVPYLDRLCQEAEDPSVRWYAESALKVLKYNYQPVEDFRRYNLTESRATEILSSYSASIRVIAGSDEIRFTGDYCIHKEDGQFNFCLSTGDNEFCVLVENVTAYRSNSDFICLEVEKKGSFLRYYLVDVWERSVSDPMTVEKLNQMLTEREIVISGGWRYV